MNLPLLYAHMHNLLYLIVRMYAANMSGAVTARFTADGSQNPGVPLGMTIRSVMCSAPVTSQTNTPEVSIPFAELVGLRRLSDESVDQIVRFGNARGLASPVDIAERFRSAVGIKQMLKVRGTLEAQIDRRLRREPASASDTEYVNPDTHPKSVRLRARHRANTIIALDENLSIGEATRRYHMRKVTLRKLGSSVVEEKLGLKGITDWGVLCSEWQSAKKK